MLFNLLVLILGFTLNGEANYITSSISYHQPQPDTLAIIDLLKSSDADLAVGDIETARQKIEEGRIRSEELNFESGLLFSKLQLADFYLYTQRLDSALITLEDNIDEYKGSKYLAQYYNTLANTYRYKNDNSKALENYNLALSILEVEKQEDRIARLHQNMAVAYVSLGMKTEALNSYLIALEYAEEKKDTSLLAIVTNNIGDTYNQYQEYERAEFYLKKSILLANEKNLKFDLLRATMNLANLKSSTGELEEALRLYNESLVLNSEVRPDTPPFRILHNMGYLALSMGDADEAIEYFNESLQVCIDLEIPQGMFYNYGGLGNAYDEKGDIDKSIAFHLKALEVAKNIESTPFILESSQRLYELNKNAGRFKDGLRFFEEFKAISDSLVELESKLQYIDLESQLDLKRQLEINELLKEKQEEQVRKLRFQYALIIACVFVILLTLYILYTSQKASKEKTRAYQKLSIQQAELEKLNQEMNKLFAIVAHDLRSPLSTMHGVLYLLKSGDLSKEEFNTYISQIEKSVQKNIDAMEDLLAWAKEQMSGITFVKEPLNAHAIVEEVISKQIGRSTLKEITIVNEIEETLLINTDENGFKLILRNLLSNAIKFSNPGDSIRFTSKIFNDQIHICVIDTGIGMSEEIQEKVFSHTSITFSKVGTRGEKGTGFGLSLIKEFVGKLNGSISIESKEGEGTKFCIELPKD